MRRNISRRGALLFSILTHSFGEARTTALEVGISHTARPQTARARISNPVSGGQCHLIHLTILRRFSWPSLAYMCTKVA